MTGFLGGGHAIHWDGSDAWLLDCFVDVPSGDGAPPVALQVPFGEELVHYAVGPGTCAVPGLPGGLDALWRRYGRLPWPRLVEPALRLARSGVTMPPAHAACLAMLAPVFTMSADGERIYAPAGHPLVTGDVLAQPGLATALELVAAEGAGSIYRGSLAEALLDVEGIGVDRADLDRYEARWTRARRASLCRDAVPDPSGALRACRTRSPGCRRCAASTARSGCTRCSPPSRARPSRGTRRTSSTADSDGNACVLTSSLGLGTGDFLAGLDLHLNSMLGEVDLAPRAARCRASEWRA